MSCGLLNRCVFAIFLAIGLTAAVDCAWAATHMREWRDLADDPISARTARLDPRDGAAVLDATINEPGDTDWIKFRSVYDGKIVLEGAGEGFPLYFEVYDENLKLVTWGANRLEYAVAHGVLYYVKLTGPSSASGDYYLDIVNNR
jgi:hypothetical protein